MRRSTALVTATLVAPMVLLLTAGRAAADDARATGRDEGGGALPPLAPRLSLVARDWEGAQLLLGHLALTDQVRLSRSSRMLVTRLRLAGRKITPFAQTGLGQWRPDSMWMHVLPRDPQLAAQIGGGFEAAIGRQAVLAVEADCTIADRRPPVPSATPTLPLWGAFVVSRTAF